MGADDGYKYGIVVDSGSSGSRIQIYKWEDPAISQKSGEDSVLMSPPKIIQEKDWTLKTTPGISTYNTASKISEIWPNHYSQLMEFAQNIIPPEKHAETPIFVLSTAGMRLLSPAQQKAILKETCSSIQSNTNFYLPNCKDYIQIIDGKTEGMYGWLGLNYLMGQFNGYRSGDNEHESVGFMDMGGASTQIAFVPSDPADLVKHDEDLELVTLRNINGDTQKWHVFVETWLGFGANEARKRFLNHLIDLSSYGPAAQETINDPCLPRGATKKYDYKGKTYTIQGYGHYETCLKSIYPLLLKNIPCNDTPCFFNGIHGPKLNFDKDKFVGISEYWYTANDIFQSGGEYNYHKFNEKIVEYCESDWTTILANAEAGHYSGLDPEKFLMDGCFKANWVLNVLHEGFELPRLGLEVDDHPDKEGDELLQVHVPFKSTDSVNGDELSWTLGRILLFASSQIRSSDIEVGIYPSKISGKEFVPGGGSLSYDSDSDTDSSADSFGIFQVAGLLLLVFVLYQAKRLFQSDKWSYKIKRFSHPVKNAIVAISSKIPILDKYTVPYEEIYSQNDINMNLEEGLMMSANSPAEQPAFSVLRTRSTINLNENDSTDEHHSSPLAQSTQPLSRSNSNFMNKPFVVPKRPASSPFFMYSENASRESLSRSTSNYGKRE